VPWRTDGGNRRSNLREKKAEKNNSKGKKWDDLSPRGKGRGVWKGLRRALKTRRKDQEGWGYHKRFDKGKGGKGKKAGWQNPEAITKKNSQSQKASVGLWRGGKKKQPFTTTEGGKQSFRESLKIDSGTRGPHGHSRGKYLETTHHSKGPRGGGKREHQAIGRSGKERSGIGRKEEEGVERR